MYTVFTLYDGFGGHDTHCQYLWNLETPSIQSFQFVLLIFKENIVFAMIFKQYLIKKWKYEGFSKNKMCGRYPNFIKQTNKNKTPHILFHMYKHNNMNKKIGAPCYTFTDNY